MACSLSPNFSPSLHYYQWPQAQFPPISLRLLPPSRHHHVTLIARAKFDKFDGSDVATSDTNSGDQVDPIEELEELKDEDDRLIYNVIVVIARFCTLALSRTRFGYDGRTNAKQTVPWELMLLHQKITKEEKRKLIVNYLFLVVVVCLQTWWGPYVSLVKQAPCLSMQEDCVPLYVTLRKIILFFFHIKI